MNSSSGKSRLKKALITGTGILFLGAIAFDVIPLFIRSHSMSSAAPCVSRLIQINAAKEEWAIEYNKTTNDTPRWNDLFPYLSITFTNSYWTDGVPVCPEGGTYTIGRIGEPPTCSIGGPRHSLPH